METKQWNCEYKPPSNYDRGHWRIYQDGITKEGFRHLIATTAPDIRDEKEHAILIASAPGLLAERDRLREINAELLAALQAVIDAAALTETMPEFNARAMFQHHAALASAAIAKATGEQRSES